MSKIIRIGTRDSELALWQANTVKTKLEVLGYKTEVIPIKSVGEINQNIPLYQMGIVGIFTKSLDTAMLHGDIDIAVHSLKDVPTILPEGMVQTAVLERDSAKDILVFKKKMEFEKPNTIATGSLRRRAQWLHKYPHHSVVDLRGNVNTRLQKLQHNDWDGAVFAKAGLSRIQLLPKNYVDLDWMVPAPAQGALVVVALRKDTFSVEATSHLNHRPSEICTYIEREFLNTLEGGCTAPIGAFAEIIENRVQFKGVLNSEDGTIKIEVEKISTIENFAGFGKKCAIEILENGGKQLMQAIKVKQNK